jgi:subtilisin family serine protease/PKD repeat protein
MKRRTRLLVIVTVLFAMVALGIGWAAMANESATVALDPEKWEPAWQEGAEELIPGEYLVRFVPGVRTAEAEEIMVSSTMDIVREIKFDPCKAFPEGLTLYHVRVEPDVVSAEAVCTLEADPRVEYVEPNRKVFAAGTVLPNDEYFNLLWGLNNIGQTFIGNVYGVEDADIDAPEAWAVRREAPEVVVAVLDADIQVDHPDLADHMWVNEAELYGEPGVDDDGNGFIDDVCGWDFHHNDNTLYDGESHHGTHTCGTIGAIGDNEIGVVGVAWNVKILPIKFIGPSGGSLADAAAALAYARQMGATITSNSWGYSGAPDQALQDAFAASDMLAICAAGNVGADNDSNPARSHYPSSYPLDNIIAVAATDCNDQLAYFSCVGATTVDLAAPGHRILSTVPEAMYDVPYAFLSGTSMATPHVAGAAALLIAEYVDMPQYPGAEGYVEGNMTIKDLLLATVDKKPQLYGKMVSGGRLNLRNALLQLMPPEIEFADVDYTYGTPPLTVNFTAEVRDPETIEDMWWDFADGSEPFHGPNATHVYEEPGSYKATFHAVDANGLEATASIAVAVFDDSYFVLIDDDGGNALDEWYTNCLDSLDYKWVKLEPPVTLPTDIVNPVIWFTANAARTTLTAEDQEWASQYLDNGGRLFLSSQGVIDDLEIDHPFIHEYLHVASVRKNVGAKRVFGIPGDPMTDGWDIVTEPLFRDRSDSIVTDDVAVPILMNDSGRACALRYVGDNGSRLIFFSFPFEFIPGGAIESGPGAGSENKPAVKVMDAIAKFLTEPGVAQVKVSPSSLEAAVAHGTQKQETLTISNAGNCDLYFDLSVAKPVQAEEIGGPDEFGYVWKDSDAPDGPAVEWVDISETGTLAVFGDDYYKELDLPFEFDFYGEKKRSILISTNGYVTFGLRGTASSHTPIPDATAPNDLIALFWADVNARDGGVYYWHDVANSRFIVSYQGVQKQNEEYEPEGSLDFQVHLYEDGRIVLQYGELDGVLDGCTVGIENSAGTIGLQVAHNEPYLHSNMAIEFSRWHDGMSFKPARGLVKPGGNVDVAVKLDARALPRGLHKRDIVVATNDIDTPSLTVPVAIEVTPNAVPVIVADASPAKGEAPLAVTFTAEAYDPDASGEVIDMWWDFGDGSEPEHVANTSHVYAEEGRYAASFHAVDDVGAEASVSLWIDVTKAPHAVIDVDSVDVAVLPDSQGVAYVKIQNTGDAPMRYRVVGLKEPGDVEITKTAGTDELDPTSPYPISTFEVEGDSVRTLKPEAVLKSWEIPAASEGGPGWPWGCGFDGEHVWVSDVKKANFKYTTDGEFTGDRFDTTEWTRGWGGDFAWDGNLMWQVSVGGDNYIGGLDPETGECLAIITDPDGIWDGHAERGLTYDPVEDVFYIGGWVDYKMYKIAGQSWAEPGKILRVYDDVTLAIAGIARVGWHLVLTLNTHPDLIAVMDSITGEIITWMESPSVSSIRVGGCEQDENGNVWMVYQGQQGRPGMAYLLDMGLALDDSPEWMSIPEGEGILQPGQVAEVAVEFNTSAAMKPGNEYEAQIVVTTSDPENQMVVLPVSMRINAAPEADFSVVRTGELAVRMADESTDSDGTIAAWSWAFGDGAISAEKDPVHEYAELAVYEVTLTVTDNDGATDTITKVVDIDTLPSVAVLEPFGGEAWMGSNEIKWTASDTDTPAEDLIIKLEFSSDRGETWKPIMDGVENSGSYIWNTAAVEKGDSYVVRVTATDPEGGVGEGESGEFTIIVLSRAVVAAPNPASQNVTFYYDIATDSKLHVYDIAGRLVYTADLASAANAHDWNLVATDGRPIANGLYLYVIVTEGGEVSEVGRLVVAK